MPNRSDFIFDPARNQKDERLVGKEARNLQRDVPLEERERLAAVARARAEAGDTPVAVKRVIDEEATKSAPSQATHSFTPPPAPGPSIDLSATEPEDVSGDPDDDDDVLNEIIAEDVSERFSEEMSQRVVEINEERSHVAVIGYEDPRHPDHAEWMRRHMSAPDPDQAFEPNHTGPRNWEPDFTNFIIGDTINFRNPVDPEETIVMACTTVDYDPDTERLEVIFTPCDKQEA